MLDPDRKQSALSGRAAQQLRQIQYNCRQVGAMSKYLNTLSAEMASSEVNCRKIQIFKTEIKQKLKEFATSIDQIYKILDRKIILMLAQLNKQSTKNEKTTQNNPCRKCGNQTNLKSSEEDKLANSQSDRLFSDTLNPRITHLEAKISQYQTNESQLKNKIKELKDKNQALLDEFNRLSTASNNKINELTVRIERDSFNLSRQYQQPSNQAIAISAKAPALSLTPTKKKRTNSPEFLVDQLSYEMANQGSYNLEAIKEEKSKFLNFGCMPTTKITSNPLRVSNMSEPYQKLDRNDKNRRFDLLLNKLRNSQQESTQGSHSEQIRLSNEPASVFSQNIVQRYQI